jgi:hypothetical protein
MADSKFSGLRSFRHEPRTAESEPATSTPEAPREKGRGRPTGKRSNPDWKLYSHFLKKRTQREAGDILRAEDKGRDLSDVLQELLEQWIAKQRGG